ncbi:hypothetical protein GGR44_001336 [Sphingobium fontiphilum]|uniref:Uncharacterized protein n=1 Tax=Sphingobium fontiphilum TaxID=944425 RepID=A0A7W6DMF7_9SPHN|nr:hypothetical protein [Sphingobium fontiphilum]
MGYQIISPLAMRFRFAERQVRLCGKAQKQANIA